MSAKVSFGPLTRPEWEALLFEAPAGIRSLVFRLAVYHGAVEPAPDGRCPCCGCQLAERARQLTLEEVER